MGDCERRLLQSELTHFLAIIASNTKKLATEENELLSWIQGKWPALSTYRMNWIRKSFLNKVFALYISYFPKATITEALKRLKLSLSSVFLNATIFFLVLLTAVAFIPESQCSLECIWGQCINYSASFRLGLGPLFNSMFLHWPQIHSGRRTFRMLITYTPVDHWFVGFLIPVDAADTGEEKFGKRASCRGKYHDSDIPS